MIKFIEIIFIVLIIVTSTHRINASGWTKESGKGFYSLEYRVLSGSKYHNAGGINVAIPKLTDIAFNFYAEYGLTNNLTTILNFPFYKIKTHDGSGFHLEFGLENENSGIGDFDFGFRYRLWVDGQTTISSSFILGIPISQEEGVNTNFGLPLGDGEFNQTLGLEFGHSLYPMPAYISGSIHFNLRSKGYSEQLYYSVEVGYKVFSNLLLNIRIHALQSLHNGNNTKLVHRFLFSNNQQFIAYKFGMLYNIAPKFGVSASFESGIVAYNIQSAPVFSIGIFLND
ncbi:MAG: hypothetical protein V3V16_08325 [Melioribacteraceae bacterium]